MQGNKSKDRSHQCKSIAKFSEDKLVLFLLSCLCLHSVFSCAGEPRRVLPASDTPRVFQRRGKTRSNVRGVNDATVSERQNRNCALTDQQHCCFCQASGGFFLCLQFVPSLRIGCRPKIRQDTLPKSTVSQKRSGCNASLQQKFAVTNSLLFWNASSGLWRMRTAQTRNESLF